MGAIDHAGTFGDLINLVNEDGAFAGKIVDHVAVVDDLPAHVNGRAKGFQGNAHDIDGTNHTGAESTRFQKEQLLAGRYGHELCSQ